MKPVHYVKLSLLEEVIKHKKSLPFEKQYMCAFTDILFWFCFAQLKYLYSLTEQSGKVYLGVGGALGSWRCTGELPCH